ncbi:adenine deaminase [Campylobacter sp. 19-13652]|uniref:adenine deaminase n=1 Tax=Campylobacter sp. 19-13652 TaxID=2840180 RepID=UPI001C76250A|nr:adenine deaminase [Campylobacter sp. 19-13652]BCX79219.1 adenine deaminase [Campylobacter sp. 19-13652]
MRRVQPDLLIKNVKVVDVFSLNVVHSNVAIKDGKFLGVGDYYTSAECEVDAGGVYMAPTLIDGHVHIESSMLSPAELMRELVSRGVSSIVADPHEIANVCGISGVEYILNQSENIPAHVYVMLPSCVPATEFETSGARLDAKALSALISHERVLGLGEMMDFVGVINGKSEPLKKLELAKKYRKAIDGHSPMLSGERLDRYAAAGVMSDHECSSVSEFNDRISRGMWVQLREGSAAKNLSTLLPAVTLANSSRCFFCTDDRHPSDLKSEGSIDYVLKKAIKLGLDPLLGIRMASLNAHLCYGIERAGAIACGYRADFFLFDDLHDIRAKSVYIAGELIAQDGTILTGFGSKCEPILRMRARKLDKSDLRLALNSDEANVIGIIPDELITEHLRLRVKLEQGEFKFSDDDICKAVVLDRHSGKSHVGLGLVKGYGIKRAAVATSVAHDSHNIIAIGDNDDDILAAVNRVVELGGGMVVASKGRVIDELRLDIAGLMSSASIDEVASADTRLVRLARSFGVIEGVDPFMTLSFLALPVLPHLKLTDLGLFDVDKFKHIRVDEG